MMMSFLYYEGFMMSLFYINDEYFITCFDAYRTTRTRDDARTKHATHDTRHTHDGTYFLSLVSLSNNNSIPQENSKLQNTIMNAY